MEVDGRGQENDDCNRAYSPVDSEMEHCETCGEETEHRLSISIIEEGDSSELGSQYASYSREPYRVAECVVCGTQNTQRINNL